MASRGEFTAHVVANDPICREHYRITLAIADFPPTRPGQFVQVACRTPAVVTDRAFDWSPGDAPPRVEGSEFAGGEAFLRRPFSIAGRRDVGAIAGVEIIGREVGPGTRFLAGLSVGDAVSVIGPLGNAFALPQPGGIALLVGGGVGIPPMIYLAQALRRRAEGANVRAVAFAGATTRDLLALTVTDDAVDPRAEARSPEGTPLYNVEEFARHGVATLLTTDDGSLGAKGYVTGALERYLDAWITDNADRARAVVYTCGPEPMMKRVQAIAAAHAIRCQIAVERAMACGMGTCQSCCIRVRKADPAAPPSPGRDWCYRLACTDGPVFGGDELMW